MNRGLCHFVSDRLEFGVMILTVRMKCKSPANSAEDKTLREPFFVDVCLEFLRFLYVIHKTHAFIQVDEF
jgi:hypothetical protein